jgi:hypothetical protein
VRRLTGKESEGGAVGRPAGEGARGRRNPSWAVGPSGAGFFCLSGAVVVGCSALRD